MKMMYSRGNRFLPLILAVVVLAVLYPADARCSTGIIEDNPGWVKLERPFPIYLCNLKNGLRVVCQPRKDNGSVVALLTVHVGSRYESESVNGISHFLEHMVLDGTEKWSEAEIPRVINGKGGRYNGFTSKEYTAYYVEMASDFFDTAMDWLSQVTMHPTIPPEEVDKERNIIFQENYNKRGWLLRLFESMGFGYDFYYAIENIVFPQNPLRLRVIGEDRSLVSIDREKLLEWYRKYYNPSNMTLIVVGGITPEEVYRKALEYFSEKRPGPRPSPPETPALPEGRKNSAVLRGPMDSDICSFTMGFRTPGFLSRDYFALKVLAKYLNRILRDEIRTKRGLSYYVWAYNVFYSDAGYFLIYAKSSRKNLEKIEEVSRKEILKVKEGDIDTTRVEEAKNEVKGKWILSMETNYSRAFWLKNWTMAGEFTLPDYTSLVEEVKVEDLINAVARYYRPKSTFVVKHIPIITVASGAILAGVILVLAILFFVIKKLKGQKTYGRI